MQELRTAACLSCESACGAGRSAAALLPRRQLPAPAVCTVDARLHAALLRGQPLPRRGLGAAAALGEALRRSPVHAIAIGSTCEGKLNVACCRCANARVSGGPAALCRPRPAAFHRKCCEVWIDRHNGNSLFPRVHATELGGPEEAALWRYPVQAIAIDGSCDGEVGVASYRRASARVSGRPPALRGAFHRKRCTERCGRIRFAPVYAAAPGGSEEAAHWLSNSQHR